MAQHVNLFYMSPNREGGWVTFTAHLCRALRAAGVQPRLYKVGARTEPVGRDFGYEMIYQNVSWADACEMSAEETSLITALGKRYRAEADEMLSLGCRLVVHDPTELKNMPSHLRPERCVVIRRAGLKYLPEATFIRHPYEPSASIQGKPRSKLAVSTARIDHDKRTDILLEANRILYANDFPEIEIRGFENRIYSNFQLKDRFPEWVQSVAHYPRRTRCAFDLLSEAVYAPDMSRILGDGGGTQYTFIEAWDAGAIPVIHEDWIRDDDDMRPCWNCLVVSDCEDLAKTLMDQPPESYLETLRRNGRQSLEAHSPAVIGQKYAEFLGCT